MDRERGRRKCATVTSYWVPFVLFGETDTIMAGESDEELAPVQHENYEEGN